MKDKIPVAHETKTRKALRHRGLVFFFRFFSL